MIIAAFLWAAPLNTHLCSSSFPRHRSVGGLEKERLLYCSVVFSLSVSVSPCLMVWQRESFLNAKHLSQALDKHVSLSWIAQVSVKAESLAVPKMDCERDSAKRLGLTGRGMEWVWGCCSYLVSVTAHETFKKRETGCREGRMELFTGPSISLCSFWCWTSYKVPVCSTETTIIGFDIVYVYGFLTWKYCSFITQMHISSSYTMKLFKEALMER